MVPKALRREVAALQGRSGEVREQIKSLDTRDPKEAKARMPAAVAWADGIIAAARGGAVPLTNKQAHALAGGWYRKQLHDWEHKPDLAGQWGGREETLPNPPDDEDDGKTDPAFEREEARILRPFITEAEEVPAAQGMVTGAASKRHLAGH